MKRVRFDWTTIYADTGSGAKKWIALMRLIRAGDVKLGRVNLESLATHADLRFSWGIQTAAGENSLDTPLEKGGILNGDGLKVGTILDLTNDVNNKALVRAGVFVWGANASPVLICGRIAGEFEYSRC